MRRSPHLVAKRRRRERRGSERRRGKRQRGEEEQVGAAAKAGPPVSGWVRSGVGVQLGWHRVQAQDGLLAGWVGKKGWASKAGLI